VAIGQPCCTGNVALTCRPEAPGSPDGSCQP
jgi:hypothetical protein